MFVCAEDRSIFEHLHPYTASVQFAMASPSGDGVEASQTRTSNLGYITEISDNDVLLGRGAPIVNNPGNLRFRKLILADKERYISTSRHVVKEEIARKILKTIEERGGRFLRKLETESERRRYNVPEGQNAWVEANDAISVQKVKQALREHKTGDSRAGGKRREASPRSELLSKKQKPPPKETPAGLLRATGVAAAVTAESKRPGTDSGIVPYSREQSQYQGGMASFSTSPIPRFPGHPMGEDYPHQFQLGPYQQPLHPQQGPPPPQRSSFYPNQEHEGMDPYGYPPRHQPYYTGGTGGPDMDVTAARRQHAVYSMMDAQARAFRVASLRAAVETGSARDRTMRPGMPPPPPTGQLPPQQQHGAPFVSPAGAYPQFGGDQGYSSTHAQHATDQGGYPPYYSLPPIHDPFESNEMRAHHEYMMGRPPPPPPQQGYAGPPPQHQYQYQQHPQHEEQQEDRFSPLSGRQEETKGRNTEEQKAATGAERSRSPSSLSSAASEKKPAAEKKAGPHDEQE